MPTRNTYIIGVVSQKGGVGKSTICRLLAREFAKADWRVRIADLDIGQGTSAEWRKRRTEARRKPPIDVHAYSRFEDALAAADDVDLLIVDGLPHASRQTAEIAQHSDLVLIPTGASFDDRLPAVALVQELQNDAGIAPARIALAMCRVPATAKAYLARAYHELGESGCQVLAAALPDQAGYAEALNRGQALSETRFAKLNKQARDFAQEVIDRLSALQDAREAA